MGGALSVQERAGGVWRGMAGDGMVGVVGRMVS